MLCGTELFHIAKHTSKITKNTCRLDFLQFLFILPKNIKSSGEEVIDRRRTLIVLH